MDPTAPIRQAWEGSKAQMHPQWVPSGAPGAFFHAGSSQWAETVLTRRLGLLDPELQFLFSFLGFSCPDHKQKTLKSIPY